MDSTKTTVSVSFQVPESTLDIVDGKQCSSLTRSSPPLSPMPRAKPALRTRAFTTGSLWEILNHARASPAQVSAPSAWVPNHHKGRSSVSSDMPGRPLTHTKLITDYVHMERRHRRRHWSEFNALGSGGAGSPKNFGFSPSPSASITDLKGSAMGMMPSEGLLKPSPGTSRLQGFSRGREVQMRLEPRMTSSRCSWNRNSLLATGSNLSSSLTCLSSIGKRRTQSAPTSDSEPDPDVIPDDDFMYGGSLLPYWRTPPVFSDGMSYLADSMRSISLYRKSSVNSTGSCDDEQGGGRDGCLTPSGTFNVSSGSSVCVPSYRIAIVCGDEQFRSSIVDLFISLGDTDDDDVFVDDDGPEKGAFVMLEGDEYYLTFTNGHPQDAGSLQDVDAWVVLHDANKAIASTSAILDGLSGCDVTCGVLLWAGCYSNEADKSGAERLAMDRSLKLIDLPCLTPPAAILTLTSLVQLLQGSERAGLSTPQLPVMRNRRMPGLSFHDVTVDKQTLFNRFFRRTLSTKSCDNLLAL